MDYKANVLISIYVSFLTLVACVPIKLQVRRGQQATLMCLYHGSDSKAQVRWRSDKDGLLTSGMIVYKHTNNIEVQKPTHNDWNLIIKKVDDAFAGLYTCATSTGEEISKYKLEIVDGPRIIQESSSAPEMRSLEGTPAELKCEFAGEPKPSVRWYRGLKNAVDTQITGEILRLPDVSRYATDTYICEGTNFLSSVNYTIDLKVTFAVEVDVMEEEIHARLGAVVSLVCAVQGEPIMDAYWTDKYGNKLKKDWQFNVRTEIDDEIPVRFITATFNSGTLGFHDFGDYSCEGVGDGNRAKKVARLVQTFQESGVINYN